MDNLWIKHVIKYANDNNISFKDAMSKSKKTYKPQTGGSKNSGYIQKLLKTGEFDISKVNKPSKSLMEYKPKTPKTTKTISTKTPKTAKTSKNKKDTNLKTNLLNLINQNKTNPPFIEYIEKLIETKKNNSTPPYIIPYQLFNTLQFKKLLNKLNEKYTLEEINNIVVDLIEELGGIAPALDTIDLGMYYKNLNTTNKRKIIKE